MPLPGGPADKFGNRYEHWWTVLQLVRVIDGQAMSIRIETPAVDKAEFVLAVGDHQELHQAKRSHPNGKWSLSSLGAEGLLQAMFDRLSEDSSVRFVFVSGSDAPELRELAERAVSAENLGEFEAVFVSANVQKEALTKLKSFWHGADTATAYEILQRIEVRTIDERGLEERVQAEVVARFPTKPDEICDILRGIVEDSIHKTIDRELLISTLQGRGFPLRKLTRPDAAPSLIADLTTRYLEATRRKLIQGSLIPRSSTQELLAKIKEGATRGTDCVLTGKAGGGKTGCVIECVEALRQGASPAVVLAFRLDRLTPGASTKELGEQLGLEESPAFVLATAAESIAGEAVLVIDQLDAVSTTSGRSADFFDVVEDLLSEVRSFRARVKFHVVVVCREFDWKNDHRLRPLLPENAPNIAVTDFSLDEVKFALTTSGFNTNLFGAKQLELLRLPQNLALFLDAHYDPHSRPMFSSPKELFDQYWREKRQRVNERANPLSDDWSGVIQVLCAEMTASQQLSALKEKLDRFPDGYLDQMASEGVLSFDGNRYGFGHESFFDYCFARGFVAKEESLTAFLVNSEQHLFRRAQVRQVLVYLRDADRERYCRELDGLLADERIRFHLKDLAVALAVSLPDPEENEWEVLAPWIESELKAISSGEPNPDKFASMVWNHFLASPSWFAIADEKGLVAEWLASENDSLIDTGVTYVQRRQQNAGDRVAVLLEPFVGRGGQWPQRLRYVVRWAGRVESRRFFELFLSLIDDGTLDDARPLGATGETFWNVASRLVDNRLDWVPEVLAHWLRRRFSIVQETREKEGSLRWPELFNHDNFGVKPILDAGTKYPGQFVRQVLPVILTITDETVYTEEKSLPKRDAIWPYLINSEHASIDQVCRQALSVAVEKIAEDKTDDITEILAELRSRDTYMANYLLLRAYTAGATHFADDAVSELCDKFWRFECGYADSPYWIAIQLIEAVAPLCSEENRARLEDVILDYVPHYERTSDGYKLRGHASFTLLSGILIELRSKKAQARYRELERKFGAPDSPPKGVKAYWVGPPIKEAAAEKMTDEQWLEAIREYDSEESKHRWENPEKGGAVQLAQMLQGHVKQDPERFARLSFRFPAGTNPVYLEHTLMGLKETAGFTELKLEVCRKAYSRVREACGRSIADLLGSVAEPLPDDAVQMLDWLATQHPEPEEELWRKGTSAGSPDHGGRLLDHGINTTRGLTAWAIRDLIGRDASYIERFRPTVERLVDDKSLAVRACAASSLLAVTAHNWEFALEQFHRLIEPRENQFDQDRLLATHDVVRFVHHSLREHFARVQYIIERMLRSELPETSEAGARLASLAVLYGHTEAEKLVEEALQGSPSQRLGVAQVASSNLRYPDCRQWSERQLLPLFNDTDSEVRQEAARCFFSLKGHSLESYENLINKFCDSTAYQEDSSSVLHALEESPQKLPGITHTVCEKFLERFGNEVGDIRTRRAGDSHSLAKLILRTYHQHQRDEWASQCLDLIDRMCLEGVYDVRSRLDEYER